MSSAVPQFSWNLVASENSLADKRHSPNGGGYRPGTYLLGFVWCEWARADHECVVPGPATTSPGSTNSRPNTMSPQ